MVKHGGFMYLILVYDISTEDEEGKKRLPRVMKKCRQFLHHIQKSVFEGEITESKFLSLKTSLEKMIKKECDYVVFYTFENRNYLKRENLGKKFDLTSNIL